MAPLSIMQILALVALPLLLAITLHEVAHAYVANRCGDNTAAMMGRLSFNPLKHIDLFGTILLPASLLLLSHYAGGPPLVFGWAKPVPINPNNFKQWRRDQALVAAAGPASNILMSFLWALIMKCVMLFAPAQPSGAETDILVFLVLAAQYGIIINLVFAVLNMIPLPPLDGARIVAALLRGRAAYYYAQIEPYGMWILLAALLLGLLGKVLFPIVALLRAMIYGIFHL